jgi:hypothetical protein
MRCAGCGGIVLFSFRVNKGKIELQVATCADAPPVVMTAVEARGVAEKLLKHAAMLDGGPEVGSPFTRPPR